MLTGRPPFEGPTLAATIYKVVHEYTTEPARLNPRAPADLSAVCMKALEKEPKDRYRTAEEFAQDMDRFLGGEPVSAKPLPAWQRLRRQVKRNRKVLVAAGSVGAAAVVALALVVAFMGRSELDLIEQNLARPEMRLVALKSLLEGLGRFDDPKRALALARGAVAKGTDEASREVAYAKPVPELAEAYAAHLPIEKPERLRARLIQVLALLKHRPAVPAVLEVLRSSRGVVRIEAIRFFRAVPDASAFYDLGRLVSDPECGVEARASIQRLYVDRVLAIFNPAAARTGRTLGDLGEAVESYNRQMEEVLGAGRPKAPGDAVEAAIAELKHGDPARRMKAAWELGESSGDARGREPLLGAVADTDDGVSRMAAAALERLGAAGLKERILDLLKHPRPGPRRSAAFLLGKIGDKSARPAIEAAHRSETDAEAKYAMEDALVLLR
jgi:HEAT repeat protein